jgi:hypothetical protein
VKLIFLLLTCFTAVAWGQEPLTLTDAPPTTYTNGTPITSGTALTYCFFVQPSAAGGAPTAIAGSCSATPTFNVAVAPVGTDCYSSTATVASQTSVQSNVVCQSVPQQNPNPPQLSVTVPATAGANVSPVVQFAYNAQTNTKQKLGVVGFVPIGTTCSGTNVFNYRGQTYQKVPASSVTWWDVTPVSNFAAPCALQVSKK